MGFIIKAAVGVGFALGLFFVVVFAASEMAGEVVTVHTYHAGGLSTETPLWIVDEGGRAYLRAGMPDSKWFVRLQAEPNVDVVRDGVTTSYTAVVAPQMRDRVNLLMAEKYGWAESLLGLMRDSESTMPIRLDRAAH